MKKNLFLGMAALLGMSLAFTACSSDEDAVSSAANNNAIGFSVLTGNAAGTRATAITASNYTTKMEGFSVYAYFNSNASDLEAYYLGDPSLGGVVFENKGEGAFDYKYSSDLHYWPTDGKELNIYAVYPPEDASDKATGSVMGGTNDLYYTVPTEQAKQSDLMFAHMENLTKSSDGVNDGQATLTFEHKLSQVLFKAKSVSEAIEVEIKGITIHNVINNGSFDIDDNDDKIGEWELKTDEHADSHYSNYSVGLTSPAEVTYENSESENKTVSATDEDGVLMLLPQQLTAKAKGTSISNADANNQCYIEVEAKIKSIGFENGNKTNTTYLLGSETSYGKTYIGLGTNWEEGKKYTYTLVFGDSNGAGETEDGDPTLTKIGFNVDVEENDWTDYDWANDDPTKGEIKL